MGNKDNKKKKTSARKYKKNRLLNLKNILPNINNELSGEQCHDDNAEVLLPSLPESSDVVYENLRPVTPCFFGIQSKIQDADKTIEAASLEVPDATDSTITTIQDEPTTPPPPPTQADEDMPFLVESECETRTKEITGRRIVDIIYFLKQLQEQKHDPLFKCDISLLDLQTEKRCGLVSHFSFVCKMCKRTTWRQNGGQTCKFLQNSYTTGASRFTTKPWHATERL